MGVSVVLAPPESSSQSRTLEYSTSNSQSSTVDRRVPQGIDGSPQSWLESLLDRSYSTGPTRGEIGWGGDVAMALTADIPKKYLQVAKIFFPSSVFFTKT
jgi:hypothetical protein